MCMTLHERLLMTTGLIIGSMISKRYGRRMVMFVMSVYSLGTAAICIFSQNRAQILTGRILNC